MACGDRQSEPMLESKTNQINSIIKPSNVDGRMDGSNGHKVQPKKKSDSILCKYLIAKFQYQQFTANVVNDSSTCFTASAYKPIG